MSYYNELVKHQKEISLLDSVNSVLFWDKTTVMPPAATEYRGEQMALLANLSHQRQTSSTYSDLLNKADEELAGLSETDVRRINVQKLKRDNERASRLPEEFVTEFSKAQVAGGAAWEKAKRAKDFSLFAEPLEKLVNLARKKAGYFDSSASVYDTLIQDFEWGTHKEDLDRIFPPLKKELIALVQRLSEAKVPQAPVLSGMDYDEAKQRVLTEKLFDELGFSKDNGAAAISSHPFSCTLGADDFRITTRFLNNELMSGFMATAHEIGHSLYERGLPSEHRGTPVGSAVSSGIHESQSLFWENRVGRSQAFLSRWFPTFKEQFPEAFAGGSESDFYHAVNKVTPSLIRVEADEVTYCLHIIIRYEIEKALLDENMEVGQLPEVWNQKYREYLGITPPDDGVGCLQDIHWAEGLFGYFPSYALGHLISAQFSENMEKDLGSVEALITGGEFRTVLGWLRRHIHNKGGVLDAPELIEEITGKPLSEEAFISYLRAKYP